MDDEKYMSSFQLIAQAGEAKAEAIQAIKAAREGRFEDADILLKSAEEKNAKAHDIQFGMIQQESSGTPVNVNVILIHAQDHLTMAMTMQDIAEEMIELYKRLSKQEE
ncbi:MAG: PTS lactose/cellobiose transporter subunit IIA [Ruminococcus flavefaciens]|nr:PTS lactose/cellobiose transporter subunit IIA [Ruminococcus flavefaciens]